MFLLFLNSQENANTKTHICEINLILAKEGIGCLTICIPTQADQQQGLPLAIYKHLWNKLSLWGMYRIFHIS